MTGSPRGGVQHLLQALVHHVAVALQREHDRAGLDPLHPGGDRRRAAVECLYEVDVDRCPERRVAPDAEYRDRTLRDAHLRERVEEAAQRQRFAAAGAHLVLLGEEQFRFQRLDDGRVGGRGRGVERPSERAHDAASCWWGASA